MQNCSSFASYLRPAGGCNVHNLESLRTPMRNKATSFHISLLVYTCGIGTSTELGGVSKRAIFLRRIMRPILVSLGDLHLIILYRCPFPALCPLL
jgi:hypothetical protein